MKQAIENLLIKSPQVLIVDDDPDQLAQMVDWLDEREGTLYQARSSEQALKILNQQWVDAVITDWQLPEMSGLDLIRHLRSSTFSGPLLICTGMMLSPDHLRQAFADGANDYLRKPLNGVELNARLDNSLQLYAHREILRLFNHSQSHFIDYLSAYLGQNFQQLLQLQTLSTLKTQGPGADPSPELALTQTLVKEFHKLMLWARYRFSLTQVQFRRTELRQLLKSLEPHFAEAAQRLIIRGGRDVYLYSDPDILQRILHQLLDNALKYTSGRVTLKVTQDGQLIRIAVRDEGQTLSEGALERLTHREGAGLGLHICHDLLSLLGSRLQARQTSQGGSQFFFELSLQ
ncbi:MAG: hybrid sensor histidine kinase/response regulator [Candidatus Sericytochromatia bacterium]